MSMKKVLCIVLAAVMALCLAGCAKKETPAPATDVPATDVPVTEAPATEEPVKWETAASYTYNTFNATFPTNWSPHSNQTNTDSDILSYIGTGFYGFDFNETMDGYVILPEAAKDFPTDVSADYVGDKWGIAEGEESRAWNIPLREDLCWEDGTPITAKDYVTSAELLLNPAAQNYRANNLYTGQMVVVNAEKYLKQNVKDLYSYADIAAKEGVEVPDLGAAHPDEKGYINWANSYGDTYDWETKTWTGKAEDEWVETPLTIGELYDFYTTGAGAEYCTWADDEQKKEWACDELEMQYVMYTDAVSFEDVGVIAKDDYNLVLVLQKPLKGFYLYYSLGDTWLVNEELYHKCETIADGVYNNTYGTSLETTISFGPYKLTSFQNDKVYTLEKNDKWFGFKPGERWENRYQTTCINCAYVSDTNTAMEMFLNGQLDQIGLNKDYIDDYMTSDYKYNNEGDSVFAMVFNPDKAALEANQKIAGEHINKTILTLKDFRKAMSLGINREEFIAAADPTSVVAYALYGNQIVSDPDNGTFYRQMDSAKQVVVDFWGLTDEVGEGKMYANNDEAIDSLTGYNPEMAKELLNSAYDEAVAQGLMTEEDTVLITVGVPNPDSATYNAGYDYIVNNYTELAKGTKLEGKLTFNRDDTVGNAFASKLQDNTVDMLYFVGWTGSTFDPYNLMEVYVNSNYQYDSSWDATKEMITINLNGTDYTASAFDWQKICVGDTIEGIPNIYDDQDARNKVLTTLEGVILQNYDFIPLIGDASASLKGMKINYQVEDEVFPMGRGGIAGITYNYTDAEWADFVASQGGTLNYK